MTYFEASSYAARGEHTRNQAPVQLFSADGKLMRLGVKASCAELRPAARAAPEQTVPRTFLVFVEPPLRWNSPDHQGFNQHRFTFLTMLTLDTMLLLYLTAGLRAPPACRPAARHAKCSHALCALIPRPCAEWLSLGVLESEGPLTVLVTSFLINVLGAVSVLWSQGALMSLFIACVAMHSFLGMDRVICSTQIVHYGLYCVLALLATSCRLWTSHTFFQIARPHGIAAAASPQGQGQAQNPPPGDG